MHTSIIWIATTATLAVASLAVTSSAEARAHHHSYRDFGAAYGYAPLYAPRYLYAAPYGYHRPFGSNSNPDRQMVGIGS
jgi:hypothetical protein